MDDQGIANTYKKWPFGRLSNHSHPFFITDQHNCQTSTTRRPTQHYANSVQYNMYFGKSIIIAAVGALSLVSTAVATPIERNNKGFYPGACNQG